MPYFALSVLMYLSLDVSLLLTLALAIPAAGFLLRTFILFHDCTHGAFVPTRRANTWLGIALGVVVFRPSTLALQPRGPPRHRRRPRPPRDRRRAHADGRGVQRDGAARALAYRLFRNPLVMFGFGPLYSLVLQPRVIPRDRRKPRIRRSILGTNVALVVVVGRADAGWSAGRPYLLVQLPPFLIGGAAGVFLFYVQHQFEDTYWERRDDWSFAESALQGSSHLKLPQPLQFFTGNIGSTTSTTSTRGSRTTTSSAHTTRTRSSTTCRRCRCGTAVRSVRLKL